MFSVLLLILALSITASLVKRSHGLFVHENLSSYESSWLSLRSQSFDPFRTRQTTYQGAYLVFGYQYPDFTGLEFDSINKNYCKIRIELTLSSTAQHNLGDKVKDLVYNALENLEVAMDLVKGKFYMIAVAKLFPIDGEMGIELLNADMKSLDLSPYVLEILGNLFVTPITSQDAFDAIRLDENQVDVFSLNEFVDELKIAYHTCKSMKTSDQLRCSIGVFNGLEAVRICRKWLREKHQSRV
jgi:hypothetical protein